VNIKSPIAASAPWLDLLIVAVYSALGWTALLPAEPARDIKLLFQFAARLGQEKLALFRNP